MKKMLMCAMLALVTLTGCTTANSKGKCVGLDEKGKQAGVEYKLSGWNVAMAVIFCETIVVPIVVILDDCKCPVEN